MASNILKSLFWGTVLLAGLSACEMRDELKGKFTNTEETGRLVLDLSLPTDTKATNDIHTFPVSIVNKETGEEVKSYPSYAELLDENPIELPVGTYLIGAHTYEEFKSVMFSPYYMGEKECIIENNISSETNVVCKVQNVKFALTLNSDFTSTFKDYNITVTVGSIIQPLTDSGTKGNFDPVYFKIAENTKKITMKVQATTNEGASIDYDVDLNKKNADSGFGDNSFFEGGDALNVTLRPTDDPNPDQPNPDVSGVGIAVTVDLTFNDSKETITIEVSGDDITPNEPENPSKPGEDDKTLPALNCEYFNNPISFNRFEDPDEMGEDVPKTVDIEITAPNKIEHLYVTITSSDPDFSATLSGVGLGETFDMTELTENQAGMFDGLGLLYAGIKNSTSYTFSIGKFMSMLGYFGGTHTFTIKVIDTQQKSVQDNLVITVIK